ncbi:MAG: thioredoxin family protein [Owenweeksia sp.]|nr:thioredoxin family protein [Owenweeksia sp.]
MAVLTVNDSDFKDQLSDNPKVVVKYFATWCGSCRLFAPKYKRVSDEDGYEDVVFLEVDAEKSPEARKAGGVDNLPFAAFKNGELLEQGVPAAKEEYLKSLLGKS